METVLELKIPQMFPQISPGVPPERVGQGSELKLQSVNEPLFSGFQESKRPVTSPKYKIRTQ